MASPDSELFGLECHFTWIPEDLYSKEPLKTLQYLEDDLSENEGVVVLGGSLRAFLRAHLGTEAELKRALEVAEEAVDVTGDPSKEKDPRRRIGFQLVALGNLAHIQHKLKDESGFRKTLKSIHKLRAEAAAPGGGGDADDGDSANVDASKTPDGPSSEPKIREQGGGDDETENEKQETNKPPKPPKGDGGDAGDDDGDSKEFDDLVSACIVGSKAYALNQLAQYNESLVHFREAEELDPDNYMWPLGRGVTAGRLQRHYGRLEEDKSVLRQLDTEQEESLERAAELTEHLDWLILTRLADVYFWRGRGKPNDPSTQDTRLMKKTEQLLLEAYELNPDSSTLLKRIGKALPEVYRCHEPFAEKCLLKAVELEPTNSMALHRLGQFYEHAHTSKDLAKAEANYVKAVDSGPSRNLAAEMDLGRVRNKRNRTYDLYKHVVRMEDFYPDEDDKIIIRKRLEMLESRALRRGFRGMRF